MRRAGHSVWSVTDVWYCELLTQPSSARTGFTPGSFEASAASVVPGVCFVLPGWSWQLLGLGSSKPLWKFLFPSSTSLLLQKSLFLPMEPVCFWVTPQAGSLVLELLCVSRKPINNNPSASLLHHGFYPLLASVQVGCFF